MYGEVVDFQSRLDRWFEGSRTCQVDVGIQCEIVIFFFSSRRRHTRCSRWSSDVCSSDLSDKNHRDQSRPRASAVTCVARYLVSQSLELGRQQRSEAGPAQRERALNYGYRTESFSIWEIGRASCRERV